ncbi:MAG: 3'-5' exonuclease domain-containing protein 2 [Bacteroidales bacterium]|nr:3'-5' exonuclease domain-containing protein 2 [Bacteroidales bacterium]
MTENSFKPSITPEELEKLPLEAFKGEIVVIDAPGIEYYKALQYLRRQKVLGFDTETRPVFEPHQPHHGVALLQLSGPDKAFLFRVCKMGLRRRLRYLLSNPGIIKVGAASGDDVRCLQRLAPFEGKGFVDLQKIGWEWGIKDKSVKKMAGLILGIRISKTQQLSNWETENLSAAQQLYAATDAWVCREMYLKLKDTVKKPLKFDEQGNIKEG